MFTFILACVILFFLIRYIVSSTPDPIYNVYSQKSKIHTLKYWLFLVVLNLRKKQNAKKTNVSQGEAAGYGMKSRSTPEDMDKPQQLNKDYPKAVDAVYFNGGNREGYYMVTATARRHDRLVQTLLFIRIPGVGLLELPCVPETNLKSDKDMSYSAGGLEILVVEPMKKWKITFEGKLRLKKPDGSSSEVDVHFDVDWTATTRYFDFDTDLDVSSMADCIAREPWSRKFFDNLKVAHQTHYEQFGDMTGQIHVNSDVYDVEVQGVRDHSYGNLREWSDLHRYAIQYAYLEDGTSICIGNICMKPTMTRLIIGYVFHPDGRMDTVSWTDLELHRVGEDGQDPNDFNIVFAAGADIYNLVGHVEECPIFYMGEGWEARVHERLCTYIVNGKKGWGISEWEFCNPDGRESVFKRSKITDNPL